MANPRVASVRAAEHTTRELKTLFAKLGTEEHPRGQVKVAYANAQRALRDVLRRLSGPAALVEAQEVLGSLRRDVADAARNALGAATALGEQQAKAEAEAWGIPLADVPHDVELALSGWMAPVDKQIAYALSLIGMGGDPALILGDDSRQGVLRHSEVTRDGAIVLTGLALLAMRRALQVEETRQEWDKQAIAAIDERTADCCLRVHGQIQPMKGRFELSGTPRYADRMDWSPFHDWCRTSVCMIPHAQGADDLTAQMIDAAQFELSERERTGETTEIHPAHARSRRA